MEEATTTIECWKVNNPHKQYEIQEIQVSAVNLDLVEIPIFIRHTHDLKHIDWFEHHYVDDPCDDVSHWFVIKK